MKELNKIMYAEDEPDIRMIVQVAIEATSPCQIAFAENGKDLLDKVEDFMPDLIMLDVMMPEMDGPTALKKLRENPATKDIPVIFMTAKAQVHELEELKSLGVVDVLTKPFDPIQLYTNIKEIWDRTNG